MEVSSTSLATLLKNNDKYRNLSLRKLSKEVAIDSATLSRILSGKQRPNMHHLEKLAVLLELPLEELLLASGYKIGTKQAVTKVVRNPERMEEEDIFQACFNFGQKETSYLVEKELDKYGEYVQLPEGKELIANNFEKKITSINQMGPIVTTLQQLYNQFCGRDIPTAAFILIGSALLYFIISPDVIPDFLFPLGFIDDAMAIKLILNKLSGI